MKRIFVLSAVVFLLFFSACKDSGYDITGTWTVQITISGSTVSNQITFSGSKEVGNAVLANGASGQYTVTNKSNIVFSVTANSDKYGRILYSFQGIIHSDTSMSGTGTARYLDISSPAFSLSWTAVKM